MTCTRYRVLHPATALSPPNAYQTGATRRQPEHPVQYACRGCEGTRQTTRCKQRNIVPAARVGAACGRQRLGTTVFAFFTSTQPHRGQRRVWPATKVSVTRHAFYVVGIVLPSNESQIYIGTFHVHGAACCPL